jgi:hypothetical protein
VGSLSVLGIVAFVAVSLWAGARLLLLGRRTREIAELSIGAALFCGGAGYGAFITAFRLHLVPDELLGLAFAISAGLLDIGVIALSLGVWKLFRPGARWAAVAFGAAFAVLIASWVTGVAGSQPNGQRSAFVFWSFNAVGASTYAWSALECIRYHTMLRRRAHIGLADPELGHRFLLWAIAGSAGAAMFAIGMAGRLFLDGPNWGVQLGQSLAGFTAGLSIWLAFFPPGVYVQRIAGATAVAIGPALEPGAAPLAPEDLFRRIRGR